MTLKFHPDPGIVVLCDFSGFKEPEMTKRRPAIVISPRFRQRDNICTIVPLSTARPRNVCAYHCQLRFDPCLPAPYDSELMWVKADMLCAVSLTRLDLPLVGRDLTGKRIYDVRHISDEDFKTVQICLLNGIGLGKLTAHL